VVGLPTASGSRVLRAFERVGFRLSHVRGRHHYLVKPGVTKLVVVPIHGNRDLPKGTLRSILRQAGMTPEQLVALL
jgi:predicted RNA binding protein YcfA (HicA-like mRNA interferase family)